MKQNNEKMEYGRRFWLPILIILAVVPLITMVHMYDNGMSKEAWAASSGETADFFLYYKSRIIMILGLIVAILLGYRLMKGDYGTFQKKNAWIPLIPVGVYAIFSLVSALCAVHVEDAFWGGYEQFEGILVLLVYIVCFLLVYGYIQKEEIVSFLMNGLIIGSLIVGILGVFQTFKIDWIQSGWAKTLLTPELAGMGDFNIKLNFEEGMAYSTLHNPNYVGSYVAIALPLTVMLAVSAKNITFKILAGISSICQLVMLYGSQSLTGALGLVGAGVAAIVFLFPYGKRHKFVSAGIVAGFAAVFIICLVAKPGILDRFLQSDGDKTVYSIQSIVTKKNSFEIETGSGETIVGTFSSPDSIDSFQLANSKGEKLAYQRENNGVITITEKGYERIQFARSAVMLGKDNDSRMDSLQIRADGKTWELVKKDGKLRYYNAIGRLDKLRKIDSVGFENNYDFATKRGYIWSRTFPMLTSTIFFGIGRDNFVYEFPNDDYVGKINSSFDGQIITKPHNMYLQIWTQDGMLACLALIALYIMLAVFTFRNCLNSKKKSWIQKMSMAILCSVTGYMIVGIANDSTICVAPVFWVLMGLGFAINSSK